MSIVKTIFWEMPTDMWSDSLLGKFIAIIWLVLVAVVSGLIALAMYMAVDNAFLSYQSGTAQVVSKRFDPAHSETYMQTMLIGKIIMTTPQTRNYPDRYFIALKVKNLVGEKQVESSFFNEIQEGKMVTVKYSKKRITDSITFE